MSIGNKIKKIREEKGMSQEELGRLADTTKQTIYKYENSVVTNIPSDKVEKIARALSVTPDYLMGWTEENKPDDVKEYVNALFARPELRTLFSISAKATKEQIEQTMRIMEALKKE